MSLSSFLKTFLIGGAAGPHMKRTLSWQRAMYYLCGILTCLYGGEKQLHVHFWHFQGSSVHHFILMPTQSQLESTSLMWGKAFEQTGTRLSSRVEATIYLPALSVPACAAARVTSSIVQLRKTDKVFRLHQTRTGPRSSLFWKKQNKPAVCQNLCKHCGGRWCISLPTYVLNGTWTVMPSLTDVNMEEMHSLSNV